MSPSSRGSRDLHPDAPGVARRSDASAAATESRETAMSEALKEAKDRHVHQLGEAYLFTMAKRRMLVDERQDAPILEMIAIHPPERRRTGVAVPPAPPPSEVSEVEPFWNLVIVEILLFVLN